MKTAERIDLIKVTCRLIDDARGASSLSTVMTLDIPFDSGKGPSLTISQNGLVLCRELCDKTSDIDDLLDSARLYLHRILVDALTTKSFHMNKVK